VPAAQIPIGRTADGKVEVKVIAGEALGVQAKIATRTPIIYQHWTIAPGGSVVADVPAGFRGMVYVFAGALEVGGTSIREGQLARLSDVGETIAFALAPEAEQRAELLLLAGVPLDEPVARHGPFVMNTREEVIEAFTDYQSGRLTTRVA
jgi:redox-sensitive bicupin YhaK (pirin superfamily)